MLSCLGRVTNQLKIINTQLSDVKILKPEIFEDARGNFSETFNLNKFRNAIGFTNTFVQDNQSMSRKGVVRGLHAQKAPNTQAKLVRVVYGRIFDVAVDIRRGSASFGKWAGCILSSENSYQLWIPEGFAHGFMALSDTAVVSYKTSNYYCPNSEVTISWNDQDIGIEWPSKIEPIISSKDTYGLSLKDFKLAGIQF